MGSARLLRSLAWLSAGALAAFASAGDASAAIVSQQDQANSIALRRRMASLGMVRQLDIVVSAAGTLHGTAVLLGPRFAGFSWHYIDDIFAAGYTVTSKDITDPAKPGKLFNINIAVGPSREEQTFVTRIASIERHPSLDFVLATQAAADRRRWEAPSAGAASDCTG